MILPSSCLVASVMWEIEESIKAATESQPRSIAGPLDRLFVPVPLRSDVLQLAHSPKLICHSGIQKTKESLQRGFWWPQLKRMCMNLLGPALSVTSTNPQRKPELAISILSPFLIAPVSHLP